MILPNQSLLWKCLQKVFCWKPLLLSHWHANETWGGRAGQEMPPCKSRHCTFISPCCLKFALCWMCSPLILSVEMLCEQGLGAARCWLSIAVEGRREEGIPDVTPSPQSCSFAAKDQWAGPCPQGPNLASLSQTRASKGLSSALGEAGSWPRPILLASRLSVHPNHCYKCGSAEHLVK